MKSKIAIIAPFKELANNAMEVCKEWNDDIHVSIGNSLEIVGLAKQLNKNGIDIIVSRDATLTAIKSAMNIPVVEIPISSWDIITALNEAKKYSKNIGIVDLEHISYQAKKLEGLLDVRISQIQLPLDRSLITTELEGVDVLLGQYSVSEVAKKYGLKSMIINSSTESIRQAIKQAYEIASLKKKEWASYEKIKAVLEHTYEGVVAVDQRGYINFINKKAQEVLKLDNAVMDKHYSEVMPFINFNEALKYKQKSVNEIYQIKENRIIFNVMPINIEKNVVGAVCTLRKQNHLDTNKVSVKRNNNGFVANCTFSNIITKSDVLNKTIEKCKKFATVDSNILIIGETGTGKELFAQSLHNFSSRREAAFVSINCAALTETLLESELFGYEDGAFTGAKKGGRTGLFELANEGTLFLDEIGDISMNIQSRLLRVLQEKEIMRVGGDKIINVDVRVITATNKEISELVKEGKFRQDLYHRLNVLKVNLPPLRERKEDILLLINWFTDLFTEKFHYKRPVFTKEAIDYLQKYAWPGNVRELQNMVERLVVLRNGSTVDLHDVVSLTDYNLQENPANKITLNIEQPLCEIEKQVILEVLKICKNKEEAAEKLGISTTTIWRKLKNISK